MTDIAVLVLEDGRRFTGTAFGAHGVRFGELVFTTGMTGYQETLTDPSYAEQIVVMTAPHIGNTGMNRDDAESSRLWVSGLVIRQLSPVPSNFRSEKTLEQELKESNVTGIQGVDTRAVTRHIRSQGAMRAGIFSGVEAQKTPQEQLSDVLSHAKMEGKTLSTQVSTPQTFVREAIGEQCATVVVLDLGVKNATLECLRSRGFRVVVVPENTTFEQLQLLNADAVFYSNGPGDPAASDGHVELLRKLLKNKIPFFGICFGNQLLGRAIGLETYKLQFGHRGINQPVLDVERKTIEITAHNHGFAVSAPKEDVFDTPSGFGKARVSHICLNDGVVEGLECLDIPAFSVQYHPEAAAGPHDSYGIFDRFRDMVLAHKTGAQA